MPSQVIDAIETICKKRKEKTNEWKWKRKSLLEVGKKQVLHYKLKPHSAVSYIHANVSKVGLNLPDRLVQSTVLPNTNFHSIDL